MHDDQFTATGPNNPASGAGFEASAFSTHSEDMGFQWGLRVLARRCGVMGQTTGGGIAGVCGQGRFSQFGVLGTAFDERIGVVGAAVENTNDLTNLNVPPGSFDLGSLGAGPGTGVLGTSGSGFGVHGVSESDSGVLGTSGSGFGVHGVSESKTGVMGNSEDGIGAHGHSDRSTGVLGTSGSGFGVHGGSDSSTAIRGTSESGFGVHGSSHGGIGGVFESGNGPGVVAKSSFGRGGVFEARGIDLVAQVGLVPQPMPVPNSVPAAPVRFDSSVLASLPRSGTGGDLLATRGQDGRCALWFCTRSEAADRPAEWSQVLLATPVASQESAFADWTSVSANVATGTLRGTSVLLSGTDISDPPGSVIDGSQTVFNRPEFTPSLPTSDAIHFVGKTGHAYTLQFGTQVTDPILHIGSLASTLHFPTDIQITRLSGDAQFSVSGSDVVGNFEGPTDDGNGTVRLSGTFTSITFTTTFAGTDGIFLQVGAPPDA
jgi:hypothetical protein